MFLTASSVVLGIFLGLSAPQAENLHISLSEWKPAVGDSFTVNIEENIGYLRHQNGQYTAFRVVTGQKRYVSYIGRYYYAKTPDRTWEVQSMHRKAPSVTFGETGRFLRLYFEGERTAYGIHGHKYAEEMLADDLRYRSMGCVIVSEHVLDIIESTYHLNGESLQVTTTSEPVELVSEGVPEPTWF